MSSPARSEPSNATGSTRRSRPAAKSPSSSWLTTRRSSNHRPEGKAWGGIKDTTEFMDLLAAHRHVKAFVFGHSHVWETKRRGPLHLVNLPPVAYVFKEGLPNGWVEARTRENGLDLNLRAINSEHPLHNQKVSLDWA